MREAPCFVCFDMATPARVVWVIVRLSLVFFAAGTWLTFHPFPLDRPAQSSFAIPTTAELDHIMLGDKPQALAGHPSRTTTEGYISRRPAAAVAAGEERGRKGLERQPELGSL